MTEHTHQPMLDKAKDASLNYAGYGYLIGDAALFAHGMLNREPKRAVAAVLWGLGGLAPALYGKEGAERQLKRVANDMGKFFKAHDIDIPKDSRLFQQYLRQPGGGLGEKIEDFLYTYPSQILNAGYAAGGANLFRSGLANKDQFEAASGALVAAGGLIGVFVPEKSDEEKKASGTDGGIVGWVTDKPLRTSGILYSLNNVTMVGSALKERSVAPNNKSYYLKFLTVASYLVANSMLGLSSKDHSKQSGHSASIEAIEKLAAEVLANQPEDVRNAMVEETAEYLAGFKEIHAEADQLADDMKRVIASRSVTTDVAQTKWEGKIEPSKSRESQSV